MRRADLQRDPGSSAPLPGLVWRWSSSSWSRSLTIAVHRAMARIDRRAPTPDPLVRVRDRAVCYLCRRLLAGLPVGRRRWAGPSCPRPRGDDVPALAIGAAILRYRLYDIDRVVSRTIAYAVVTAGLLIVYLGVNLGLSTILSSVAGSGSVAVAASTLVVAALFTPVRRRVQRVVDRRVRSGAIRRRADDRGVLRTASQRSGSGGGGRSTSTRRYGPRSPPRASTSGCGRATDERLAKAHTDLVTMSGRKPDTLSKPEQQADLGGHMQPRNLALVGAALGVRFGAVGLIAPGSLGAFFGIQMDATSTALIRLVSASYVGFGVLDWAALDLTDRAAWRVVAVANTAGWALGGVVMATALASGLGNTVAWGMVAIQVAMTIGWLGVIAWTSRTGASRDPRHDGADSSDPPPPQPVRRSCGNAQSQAPDRRRDGVRRAGRSVDRRRHRQSDPLLALPADRVRAGRTGPSGAGLAGGSGTPRRRRGARRPARLAGRTRSARSTWVRACPSRTTRRTTGGS